MEAPHFITMEGIDGCGKSTQSGRLAEWLEAKTGRKTIRTYEPGGWPEGDSFRDFILRGKKLGDMTELMLFLADRAEHVKRVILPSLRQGNNVICERYNDSTLAYQSSGQELNPAHVRRIIRACNFPEPDVSILMDISPELAMSRVKSRSSNPDKFEAEGLPLMRTVSSFYRLIAEDQKEKYIVVKCDGLSEDEVFASMIAGLEGRLWRSR
ncbi:MAG: dTMP kinase [Synergistaceae bacterium]|nr:dTMP kinase [Synergistaceae bacterium]MBQ6417470.1 dTMP kinase [Synergistaceae bacterium]MBQ6981594.1 dTMP kinase [Synergistaceae bacterium]MBR0185179.1 dTMP kinase [Synergistaceae bacterium]MBR0249406.1 dTMP kinase [Synergistaceae bacterium]